MTRGKVRKDKWRIHPTESHGVFESRREKQFLIFRFHLVAANFV
jgi:hypothetical protein